MLADWDGRFTVLMRKRIGRHLDSCPTCDEQRQAMVSPAALLGTAPVFVAAPDWLCEATLEQIELVNHSAPLPADVEPSAAKDRDGSSWLPASLFAAALVALIAVGALWMTQRTDPVTPVDDTATLPQPTTSAPQVPASAPATSSPPAPVTSFSPRAGTTPVWTPGSTPAPVTPEPQPPAPQPEPPTPAEPEVPPVPPVVVDPPPPLVPDWLPGVLVPTPPPPRPNFQGPGALAPIPATSVVPPPQLPVP